uniref:NADH-ubiquinone oxidoreductase chain 4L n=1 Tax=Heptamelus sp. TaxID=2821555 RepID=A0A8A6C9V7_9HYME|nr:NADH dehydrogenase subunit 4L [Heptamelus sp.]
MNNMFIFYLFLLFFFSGIFSLCINRTYILMVLLSLEFIMLSLYNMMILYLVMYEIELFFSMIFLVFSVCEGVLGLSILVLMVRFYGNDYFKSLSSL